MPIAAAKVALLTRSFASSISRGRDRAVRRVVRRQRRAEQRQKPSPNLFTMPPWRSECRTARQGRRRTSTTSCGERSRAGGKTAEIDEHHGNAANVALGALAFQHQTLDHLRRDVLAEQIGDAVARGGRHDAGLELPAQLQAYRPRQHAADQYDHAADAVIVQIRRRLGCRAMTWNIAMQTVIAATRPVKDDSQKSSRSVERMIKMK